MILDRALGAPRDEHQIGHPSHRLHRVLDRGLSTIGIISLGACLGGRQERLPMPPPGNRLRYPLHWSSRKCLFIGVGACALEQGLQARFIEDVQSRVVSPFELGAGLGTRNHEVRPLIPTPQPCRPHPRSWPWPHRDRASARSRSAQRPCWPMALTVAIVAALRANAPWRPELFDDLDIVWFGKELDDAVGHHRADIRTA